MQKVSITTEKTARYFLVGQKSEKVKTVLFACHGYAQLANEFVNVLKPMTREDLLIVAPEGLHRFYTRGHESVVASWMTKEERLDDIKDYIAFLDRVHDDVLHDLDNVDRIIVLGFSQGAAAVSRWTAMGKSGMDELILFCGFFPPELDEDSIQDHIKVTVVTASNDKFVSKEQEEKELNRAKELAPKMRHFAFEGEHELKMEVVKQLVG